MSDTLTEPLNSLIKGWKNHFAAADQSIEWLHSELELQTQLAPGVWLVGTIDAVGRTGDDLFFGEWKTANPREKKTWKQVWRMNPQSLSYGVLAAARWPEMRRFTVRKAFKEQVPTYDHAWFRYSEAELTHWQLQLIKIADQIKRLGHYRPWDTNWAACFKYGPNYACPFFECACNKLDWDAVPVGSTRGGDPSWSATQQRAAIHATDPHAIVLSPTMVATWLDCRERYRREYVELVTPVKGEALKLGGDFHHELADYYKSMCKVEVANG